jgi:hypothetical protein
MLADVDQIGRMTLCGSCLLSFPVPDNIASMPMTAKSKLTPRPTPEDDDAEIVLPQRGCEPGWGLVRLGLTLLQVSLIVLLPAAFVVYAGIALAGSRALANPFAADNSPVVIIATFVAATSVVTGFIGMSLCCAVPPVPGLRLKIRAAVAVFLVGGAAGANAVIVTHFVHLWTVRDVSIGILLCAGLTGVTCWLSFLSAIARHFGDRELSQATSAFMVFAYSLFTLNICAVFPCLFQLLFHFLPSALLIPCALLLIPCALYGWHLRLVDRIRHTIPLGNQRDL